MEKDYIVTLTRQVHIAQAPSVAVARGRGMQELLRLGYPADTEAEIEVRPDGPLVQVDPPGSVIFVFGSNEAGAHAGGAAREAVRLWGAENGRFQGPQGQAYALPTLNSNLEQLPLEDIAVYLVEFLEYADEHVGMDFQVTAIGTGIAGFTKEQIAPLFGQAWRTLHGRATPPFPKHVHLPLGWRELAGVR